MKIGIIFGTRPEAIKIAPLYHYFKNKNVDVTLIFTGQHEGLLDSALRTFKMKPHFELKIERVTHSLSELTAQLVVEIEKLLSKENFDYILVQGDTTSAFIGGLIAFYHRIPVGHVEAGLRTNHIYSPFPEEVNRRIISQFATHHFAPTEKTAAKLKKELHENSKIFITGNTVVDAIFLNKALNSNTFISIENKFDLKNKTYLLLTMHRRESILAGVENVLNAVEKFCENHGSIEVFYPVHPNPLLREIVKKNQKKYHRINFIEPLDYLELSVFLKNCLFVLTDSGGIQEEAPSYGKYSLVLRNHTEREEIIESGLGKLIGVHEDKVLAEMEELYEKNGNSCIMTNPYGDGHASEKILDAIKDYFNNS